MVAAFKEVIFDFEDFKFLSIVCTNCHTETVLDLSNLPSKEKIPDRCRPCKTNFDEDFNRAINDFCSAYKTFTDKNIERPISARIKVVVELKDSNLLK